MEREKLGELYDKYILGLCYFIKGYVHSDEVAEDIAEDVFVEILLHPERFRKASSEKTYLYAIGKNKAIDYLRRESKIVGFSSGCGDREGKSFDEEVTETMDGWNFEYQDDVLNEIVKREESIELKKAIACLNENYRMAIYLSYFEDMPNGEIASVMNVSKKQVENYLYRGKKELKGFEI